MRAQTGSFIVVLVAGLALGSAACTSGDVEGGLPGNIGTDGVGTDGVGGGDVPGVSDAGAADSGQPVDTYVPEPGEFGYPCVANGECDSGWCVASKQGKVCTKTCFDECPSGWNCRPLVAGDPVFLCLPRWLHICDPCQQTSACSASDTDQGHFCLDYGAEGKFCGGECGSDGNCPWGFECKNVPVGGGQVKAQCVPADGGACKCSKLATDFQLQTTCVIANEHGVCSGTRMCTAGGLTDCDAKTPVAEICNGQDDNCDGAYDNLPPDYQCYKTNEFGTCPGQGQCIGGVELCDAPDATLEKCDGLDNDCNGQSDEGFPDTDGDLSADCVDTDDDNDAIMDVADNCPLVVNPEQNNNDGDDQGDACDEDDDNDSVPDSEDCDPLDGKVSPNAIELCDNVDNDCNGLTDDNLCDDGEPCTEDSCNADGSCAHAPLNGIPCQDGEGLCTTNDVCLNGVCLGNAVSCDDGNECTADLCNPGTGQCTNLAPAMNGESCTDGSQCTTGDTCQNGICLGTFDATVCDDGNPCTADSCSAQTGCQHSSTNENGVCQSGGSNPCVEGRCQSGSCNTINKDGVGCVAPSAECKDGVCTGGQCLSKSGVTCQTKIEVDLCNDVDAPGKCSASGKCVVNEAPPGMTCPGCNGICIQCFIQLCIPFG